MPRLREVFEGKPRAEQGRLHVVEMTLLIAGVDPGTTNRQSAVENRQVREYRFLEASFERRPPSTVAPKVFEPEPELLGPATEKRGPAESSSPNLPVTYGMALCCRIRHAGEESAGGAEGIAAYRAGARAVDWTCGRPVVAGEGKFA